MILLFDIPTEQLPISKYMFTLELPGSRAMYFFCNEWPCKFIKACKVNGVSVTVDQFVWT